MSDNTGVTVPGETVPSNCLVSTVVEDVSHQLGHSLLDNGNRDSTLGSDAQVVIVASPLKVVSLKTNAGNNSSFCANDEDCRDQKDYSDKRSGDHSGNNSSNPDIAADVDSLLSPPDEELQKKIISLVEYYFSDESILKDAFLLKHVRRNRFGFVSLKLITSFKKMKALTRDYHIVAYSLKASEKLELNDECTKVRRKDPLPDYDETVPSRTVVALNLPLENPTMENMAEIFSKCGCVNNFQILRPGSSIPSDLHKFACKHPELESTMCAIVAFENYEQAQNACEILTNSDDWRKGMRVIPLMVPKKKEDKDQKDRKDKNNKKKNGKKDDISPEEHSSDDKKKRRRGGHRKKTRVDELTNDSSCNSSSSEGDSLSLSSSSSASKHRDGDHRNASMNSSQGTRNSPVGSPLSKQRSIAKSPLLGSSSGHSPRSSPETVQQNVDSRGGGNISLSPWVQRRLRVAQEKVSAGSPLGSPLLGRRSQDCSSVPRFTPRMLDMTNVLRQPKGPDNTKGFYGGLGRGKPRSSTVA